MSQPRVLIVDDDKLQRWALRKQLTSWDYEVVEAADGQAGIDAFASDLPDLVLLDLQLPDQTGIDVLRQIRNCDANAVVIMMTAHGGVHAAVSAFKLGIFDYLSKPLDLDALGVTIRYGIEARRLRTEVTRLREVESSAADERIIGESAAVADAVKTLRKLAGSNASTVLLTGESGTGKDLYARALHLGSSRAAGPFVPVNSAAIPDTLMESELFGHEKGAFTDARFLKKGVFEMADGGTLYLDEIGELRPALQSKLLRVVETLTFRRVGGTRDITVDVRVVAATNRDLDLAVQQGTFRRDLLYRLRVIEMRLKPLRERREDIPALVGHFVERFSRKFRRPITGVTPDAMEMLCRHDWPGNIRELKNAIERAVILEEHPEITVTYLPDQLPTVSRPGTSVAGVPELCLLPPGGTSLERVEESLVRQAVSAAGGNQTKAAQLLDISRDALRYKLKKFEIES